MKVDISLVASAVGQGNNYRGRGGLGNADTSAIKAWITCLHSTETWEAWVQQHNIRMAV